MKNLLFVLTFSMLAFTYVQAQDQCAGVSIDYCSLFDGGEDKLTIYVANSGRNIFAYAGFLLLNEAGDTIAKENVNYYGIPSNYQAHQLELLQPFELPFKGTLELSSNFFRIKECSFEVNLDKSLNCVEDVFSNKEVLTILNRSKDEIIFDFINFENPINSKVVIYNSTGEIVHNSKVDDDIYIIQPQKLRNEETYHAIIWSEEGQLMTIQKFVWL